MGTRDAARQLGNAYPFAEGTDVRLRFGVVTARNGLQCSVRFAGAETARDNIVVLSSTAPVVGQTVLVAQSGSDDIIVGAAGADNVPHCYVWRTANQSISSGVENSIVWQSVVQNAEMWDSAVSTSRVYVKAPGWYAVTCGIRFGGGAASGRWLIPYRYSGAATRLAESMHVAGANVPAGLTASTIQWAYENDYFYVNVYQDSGAALNLEAYQRNTFLSVHWLGPV